MRTIIPGPPGTGKTHTLVHKHLRNELYNLKTDPKKIAYISFSNAAAGEAKQRITNLFPEFEFDWICTMHSMGKRQLNIDTTTQLLKDKNWRTFQNYSGCHDLHFENIEHENGYIEYTNNYMKIIEYARSRQVSLADAGMATDLLDRIDFEYLEQIDQYLNDFKKDYNMFEFSDMISEFTKRKLCPSLDVVFLDEAQDLNPLQWDMFFYIESLCERSYIAGDDDQSIYAFQGADPKTFIDLKGTLDAQTVSRRVPKSIYDVAFSILNNIDYRKDKTWLPREEEGEVIDNEILEDIDFGAGNWMILTRTNKQQESIIQHLNNLGLRFDCKNNDLFPPELQEAINIWDRLNRGASVEGQEAQKVYNFLTKKELKHKFGGGKSLEQVDTVDIDELMMNHGLKTRGDWTLLNMSQEQEDYIYMLKQNGEDLSKPARIKVSTIHGVKGEEADNVILFTDLEGIIYRAALKNKDPEHRLFFVGVTRAKEKLYIMNQGYEHQYTIGGEIE